jgi:hypothetical protein
VKSEDIIMHKGKRGFNLEKKKGGEGQMVIEFYKLGFFLTLSMLLRKKKWEKNNHSETTS